MLKSENHWITMFFLRVAAVIALIALVVWFANATESPEPVNAVDVLDDYEAPKAAPASVVPAKPVQTNPAPVKVDKPVEKRYNLTDAERTLVEQVVMAESGAEGYDGMRLVAQCILNGCENTGMRPDRLVVEYGYTSARKTPSAECRRAVAAVFDRGDTYTDEVVEVFYAPAICRSGWHESQTFVLEYGGHRFFRMK